MHILGRRKFPLIEHSLEYATDFHRLPHRHPFFFFDKILSITPGRRITGQTTINAFHWQGAPVASATLPRSLMIEMIAQAGGALLLADPSCEFSQQIIMLTAIESASFRGDMKIGASLKITARILSLRSNGVRLSGTVSISRSQMCSATIMCQFVELPRLG